MSITAREGGLRSEDSCASPASELLDFLKGAGDQLVEAVQSRHKHRSPGRRKRKPTAFASIGGMASTAGGDTAKRTVCTALLYTVTYISFNPHHSYAGSSTARDGPKLGTQRAAPVFALASAGETSMQPFGAPAWRVALGNMAAGATAGAVVEAGALQGTRT